MFKRFMAAVFVALVLAISATGVAAQDSAIVPPDGGWWCFDIFGVTICLPIPEQCPEGYACIATD